MFSSPPSVSPRTGSRMMMAQRRRRRVSAASSEVERVVAGLPVARVSAVGPADHRVETRFRSGGVLDQSHGTIGFQNAVRSLDHVAFTSLPLALHVVRFRVVDGVIELVRFGRLWYKQTHASVVVGFSHRRDIASNILNFSTVRYNKLLWIHYGLMARSRFLYYDGLSPFFIGLHTNIIVVKNLKSAKNQSHFFMLSE